MPVWLCCSSIPIWMHITAAKQHLGPPLTRESAIPQQQSVWKSRFVQIGCVCWYADLPKWWERVCLCHSQVAWIQTKESILIDKTSGLSHQGLLNFLPIRFETVGGYVLNCCHFEVGNCLITPNAVQWGRGVTVVLLYYCTLALSERKLWKLFECKCKYKCKCTAGRFQTRISVSPRKGGIADLFVAVQILNCSRVLKVGMLSTPRTFVHSQKGGRKIHLKKLSSPWLHKSHASNFNHVFQRNCIIDLEVGGIRASLGSNLVQNCLYLWFSEDGEKI